MWKGDLWQRLYNCYSTLASVDHAQGGLYTFITTAAGLQANLGEISWLQATIDYCGQDPVKFEAIFVSELCIARYARVIVIFRIIGTPVKVFECR